MRLNDPAKGMNVDKVENKAKDWVLEHIIMKDFVQ